jgi:cytochrome c oxidase cbb3-type subunit 3/ubiquinol-cytochrome c reductase cytochrome c subunit
MSGCAKPEQYVSAESITDFRMLFSDNCSGCHGADGKNGASQSLNDPLYLALVPKEALRQVTENGRPGTSMPAFARREGGPLNENQVSALIEGIEAHWAEPSRFKDIHLPPYSYAEAADPERGEQVFRAFCFTCHGPQGVIGPLENASYLTLVSDQSLRTSLIVGRPHFGMPDWRKLKGGNALSDQDIADVVSYLSSKRPTLAIARAIRQAGPNQKESGTGKTGVQTSGNEGSGNGPGSPQKHGDNGNAGKGSSSIQGGPGKSTTNSQPIKQQ